MVTRRADEIISAHMADVVLSVLMLAGIALLIGSIYLFRKGDDRKKALLMLVASLVMFGNLAIWLVPTPDGTSLATEAQK